MSCSSAATHSPLSPRGRARDPDEIAVRGKRLCRVERELPLTLPATQLANAPLKSAARKIAAGSPLPAGERRRDTPFPSQQCLILGQSTGTL